MIPDSSADSSYGIDCPEAAEFVALERESMSETYSLCLVPTPRVLPLMRLQLVRQFQAVLGTVNRYAWRFVPKGSVLVDYDDNPPILADQDYVEVCAFGGSI